MMAFPETELTNEEIEQLRLELPSITEERMHYIVPHLVKELKAVRKQLSEEGFVCEAVAEEDGISQDQKKTFRNSMHVAW